MRVLLFASMASLASVATLLTSCTEAHAETDAKLDVELDVDVDAQGEARTAAVSKSKAATEARTEQGPSGQAPPLGSIEVILCDGETKAVVPPGTAPSTIAGQLMTEWLRKNPGRDWEPGVRERHGLVPSFDNSGLVDEALGAPPAGRGAPPPGRASTRSRQQQTDLQAQTHGRITRIDVALWKEETERFALAGSRVFHSGDELGSTIGVSCDMCHPHGANTHPETYPKFQPQLGRVALLRDMINWCIQHPVRGEPLASDDPRMRSLEAYIHAQRSGTPMAYGKH
jgi:thiosulfate dehydrogenase